MAILASILQNVHVEAVFKLVFGKYNFKYYEIRLFLPTSYAYGAFHLIGFVGYEITAQ